MPLSITAYTPIIVRGYTTTTSTSFTPILATTYVEQSSNAQRSLVSTSTDDTSAGTGARTVRITYYADDLTGPFTEDITLNGTTAVNTVATNICFIDSLEVITVGSQLGNVGTISLKAATDGGGVTVGSIAASDNQTNWCHHYIADGKAAKIAEVITSIQGIYGGGVFLRRSTPTVANTPEKTIAPDICVAPGISEHIPFIIPIEVVGPARVILYAKGNSSEDTNWLSGFSFYEVDA